MLTLARRGWRTSGRWLLLFAAVGAMGSACGESKSGPKAGSNSNWLVLCDEQTECGGKLACQCGACSMECQDDDECSDLPGGHCVLTSAPDLVAVCGAEASAGVCLPRCESGECPSQMVCADGACVPLSMPGSDFCAPVSERSDADRAREDQLLAELANLRAVGDVVCGENPASEPAPPLRLDARLWCAARVFATDLSPTAEFTLVDSSGRVTQDRMLLAEYEVVEWGESIGVGPSAAEALEAMLTDVDSCVRLSAGRMLDVGVGVVGGVAVVTLGNE